jgi:SNF2 family DNA or RNA helicase
MALSRDFTWFLTGTPVQNRVPEFVSLMYLITRSERVKRLCKGIDQKTLTEIKTLRDQYLLRRTKDGLLKSYSLTNETGPRLVLPRLIENVCWVKFNDADEKIYQNYWDLLILRIKNFIHAGGNGSDTAIHIFAALTMLRRFCMHSYLSLDDSKRSLLNDYLNLRKGNDILPPSAKIYKAVNHIQSIIKTPDNKILVFSQWTSVLDIIAYYLDIYTRVMKRAESVYVRLDGSTSRKRRQTNVDMFQAPGGPQVFLISLKAGGLGLNLHAANHVLLLDPYWNPAAEKQAIDRAHRIGQTREVEVTRLLMHHENSIEKFIRELQQKKQEHIACICSDDGKKVSLPSLRLFYDHVRRQERERSQKQQQKQQQQEEKKEKRQEKKIKF